MDEVTTKDVKKPNEETETTPKSNQEIESKGRGFKDTKEAKITKETIDVEIVKNPEDTNVTNDVKDNIAKDDIRKEAEVTKEAGIVIKTELTRDTEAIKTIGSITSNIMKRV